LPDDTRTARRILASLKGLRNHLQPNEQPLLNIPAFWNNEQGQRGVPCDVVLTNQRLLGYAFVTFPRERLFLEALALSHITTVSLRQKTFEPLFRELFISDGQRKVYIRTSRQKIEALYEALRSAVEQYAPGTEATLEAQPVDPAARVTPVYGRQDVRIPFENSPLAITMLFIGGIIMEISGVFIWSAGHSAQAGLPLCAAGFIAVMTSILVRRQRR
jgi:hypothetical protein